MDEMQIAAYVRCWVAIDQWGIKHGKPPYNAMYQPAVMFGGLAAAIMHNSFKQVMTEAEYESDGDGNRWMTKPSMPTGALITVSPLDYIVTAMNDCGFLVDVQERDGDLIVVITGIHPGSIAGA